MKESGAATECWRAGLLLGRTPTGWSRWRGGRRQRSRAPGVRSAHRPAATRLRRTIHTNCGLRQAQPSSRNDDRAGRPHRTRTRACGRSWTGSHGPDRADPVEIESPVLLVHGGRAGSCPLRTLSGSPAAAAGATVATARTGAYPGPQRGCGGPGPARGSCQARLNPPRPTSVSPPRANSRARIRPATGTAEGPSGRRDSCGGCSPTGWEYDNDNSGAISGTRLQINQIPANAHLRRKV